MKKFIIFITGLLIFLILGSNTVSAKNGEGVFDQTKAYPECLRIQKLIQAEFGKRQGIKGMADDYGCQFHMMGYNFENGEYVAVAYSTYAKVISSKKGVLRIQYKDRYSLTTTADIVVKNYIISKNLIGKTFVLNLMYNNEIDIGDYFIDNDSVYNIGYSKFHTIDLTYPNAYCIKTYGKGYKYHLLTHSCKK
ncbi:hypothetical protein K2X92_04560 [Candidatus Gracilibacteria bacterium]|nr:hypothetical protein [Candidatus Gracilibacteria bacterium]